MDYVGCARTIQVTPVDGVHIIDRYIYGTFGYTDGHSKVPRSSRAKLNVDRELRTSGHTEYGTPCLGRMERNVVGRDALGICHGKLPQSRICEMQAENWLLSGICKLWEHGALDGLAGRFRYYSWRSCKYAACVCHIVLESGSARHGAFCCLGWFLDWESGLGKCNSITRLGQRQTCKVGVLRYCSFVGHRNRSCI